MFLQSKFNIYLSTFKKDKNKWHLVDMKRNDVSAVIWTQDPLVCKRKRYQGAILLRKILAKKLQND